MSRAGVRLRAFAAAVLFAASMSTVQTPSAGSRATCGPGDRPEPALQGEVPLTVRLNGDAASGYWCNLERIGTFESTSQASFDTYGNCAYYPSNPSAFTDAGVIVIDASDTARPRQTDLLTARAMRWAGESLRVNQARGLLVANHYSPIGAPTPSYTADGKPQGGEIQRAFAVYSVTEDCAHPTLLADVIMPSMYGHEGCFQPDGMIYYSSARTVTPIDLSDPAHPRQLSDPWQPDAPLPSLFHGCSISDDGTRGYFADPANQQMVIADTSQIQARVPGAQPRLISTFKAPLELQQSTVPLTYGGKPYVLLFSELKYPPKVCLPDQPNFGFPRIIDVSNEKHPVEVSRILTEVSLPENCARVAAESTVHPRGIDKGDPFNLIFTAALYDSHYCNPDRLQDPTLIACAQFGSGLRVYDVRDPRKPLEIAYYNTGTLSRRDPTMDWAQARPVIRRDLGQIWWTTWYGGFHTARFRDGVWPFPGDKICPSGFDYFRAQSDLVYQGCTQRTGSAGR